MKKGIIKLVFTLIELLIVIGIIAVLASLLFPALGKAKEVSKKIACTSNIKQLGAILSMYENDYSGLIPNTRKSPWDNDYAWTSKLWHSGYLSTTKTVQYGADNTNCNLLKCPSDNNRTLGELNFSYGYNSRLALSMGNIAENDYALQRETFIRPAKVSKHSNRAVITDSLWGGSEGINEAFAPGGGMNYRHLRYANILFLDGHTGDLRDYPKDYPAARILFGLDD